jgi:hypothetical protein
MILAIASFGKLNVDFDELSRADFDELSRADFDELGRAVEPSSPSYPYLRTFASTSSDVCVHLNPADPY